MKTEALPAIEFNGTCIWFSDPYSRLPKIYGDASHEPEFNITSDITDDGSYNFSAAF
jgi:hypothetical protein